MTLFLITRNTYPRLGCGSHLPASEAAHNLNAAQSQLVTLVYKHSFPSWILITDFGLLISFFSRSPKVLKPTWEWIIMRRVVLFSEEQKKRQSLIFHILKPSSDYFLWGLFLHNRVFLWLCVSMVTSVWYLCVCMFISLYLCVYVCMSVAVFLSSYVWMYLFVYMSNIVCFLCICVSVCTYVCLHIDICLALWVSVCDYMYVSVCLYIFSISM